MSPSVWCSWMGATPYSVFSSLFYYLMPLLCCAPFGSTLCPDLTGGLAGELCSRTDAARYLVAKVAGVVATASATVVVPQLVNLLGTMLCVPLLPPDPAAGLFPITAGMALSELFYARPFLYLALYLLLGSLVMPLVSCLALVASFRLRVRFAVLVLPFVVDNLLYFLLFSLGMGGYAPSRVIMPAQEFVGTNLTVVAVFMLLAAVLVGIFLRRQARELEAL